jgi:hypothetical protein
MSWNGPGTPRNKPRDTPELAPGTPRNIPGTATPELPEAKMGDDTCKDARK